MNNKIKFSILEVSYWCSIGAFASLMVAFIQSKGLSATYIGIMLMVNTFCGFLGQFFFGMLCDKLKTHKKIFIVANAVVYVIQLLIFTVKSPVLIILVFGLMGFVQQPLAANMETWLLKTFKDTPQIYGPLRSCASLAFAVFMLFYGGLLENHGYGLMLVFSGIFITSSIIAAAFTKDVEVEAKDKNPKNWTALFHDKQFFVMIIMLLGAGIASAPFVHLLAVVMDSVGGTVKYVGYALFASAFTQVPFMMLSGKLKVFSSKVRISFSCLFYIISIVGLAFSKNPQMVIAFSFLNGVGFGVFMPSLRELIFSFAPQDLKTTAQGVCDATYNSMGAMICNLLAGVLIDNYSVKLMLLTCAAIQIVALVIFTIKFKYTP